MSEVICSACGKPITHCPNCFTRIPSLDNPIVPNVIISSTLPIEVDVGSDEVGSKTIKNAWDYKTALPKNTATSVKASPTGAEQPQLPARALSSFFDANAESCTCVRDEDGNVMPNPNIHRASISNIPSQKSSFAPKSVANNQGNYNVAELAKMAFDQQLRAEKKRRRKMRWIRRGIVLCILIGLILANWDLFYFACRTFLHGIDAVFEIFGLLGDL